MVIALAAQQVDIPLVLSSHLETDEREPMPTIAPSFALCGHHWRVLWHDSGIDYRYLSEIKLALKV